MTGLHRPDLGTIQISSLQPFPSMSRHFSESEDKAGCNDIVVITHQEHQQAMKTRTAEADTIVTRIMADSDDGNNDKTNPSTTTTTTTTTNGVRRRALSMAETQPSVETVVVKAKRAAQSLWMLLHAQVSRVLILYQMQSFSDLLTILNFDWTRESFRVAV